jgi:hypothetical protein
MLGLAGEVAEWLKAAVSKTVNGGYVVRGFESPPLRGRARITCIRAVFEMLGTPLREAFSFETGEPTTLDCGGSSASRC